MSPKGKLVNGQRQYGKPMLVLQFFSKSKIYYTHTHIHGTYPNTYKDTLKSSRKMEFKDLFWHIFFPIHAVLVCTSGTFQRLLI